MRPVSFSATRMQHTAHARMAIFMITLRAGIFGGCMMLQTAYRPSSMEWMLFGKRRTPTARNKRNGMTALPAVLQGLAAVPVQRVRSEPLHLTAVPAVVGDLTATQTRIQSHCQTVSS